MLSARPLCVLMSVGPQTESEQTPPSTPCALFCVNTHLSQPQNQNQSESEDEDEGRRAALARPRGKETAQGETGSERFLTSCLCRFKRSQAGARLTRVLPTDTGDVTVSEWLSGRLAPPIL